MAFVLADRVKETTTTTGTGTLTLAGAEAGFQAFGDALSNGDTTYYAIVDPEGNDWEVGLGTYASSGTTLARTTIFSSSNSGSAVNFSAGTKEVFITYAADRSVHTGTDVSVFNNDAGYLVTVSFGDLTSTPTTLSGYGITDAATSAQGALADSALQSGDNISLLTNNSGYLTTVAFGDLTSTPTTLAGYGITDAATSAQGALADSALQSGDNISLLTNNSGYLTTVAFGDLTSTPTTLLGYGITDAATSAQGGLADSAVQPGDNVSTLTNDAGYTTNVGDITNVTAGVGLSGGGSSGSVTLTVDLSELTDMTDTMVGTDEFIVLDNGADRRKAANEIGLSIFNNDAGFVTSSSTPTLDEVTDQGSTTTNGIAVGSIDINGEIVEQQYSLTGTLIDPSNGTIQYKTLAANTTFTENLSDGEYVLLLINSGSFTVTWPTTKWPKGAAPTLDTSGDNAILLFHVNGNLYGSFVSA